MTGRDPFNSIQNSIRIWRMVDTERSFSGVLV